MVSSVYTHLLTYTYILQSCTYMYIHRDMLSYEHPYVHLVYIVNVLCERYVLCVYICMKMYYYMYMKSIIADALRQENDHIH